MRKILLSLVIVALSVISAIANPKTITPTTITFKVNGTSACAETIKNALNGVHGISSVIWDATTKKATVSYNPEEIKEDMIYVYFAEQGFDTERLRAKKAKYDALPAECKYQRDPERD